MSEHHTATTIVAAAVGDRWGNDISEERQIALLALQNQWTAEADHGTRRGPFDGFRLTGADVAWLARRVANEDNEGSYLHEVPDLHLEGADLNMAHLAGALLSEAHLEGASLRDAHLEGANLAGTHLEGALLLRAHLEGAALTGGRLERALLWEAHMERALLIRTHLEGAGLDKTHLEDAVLAETHLEGARLSGTHLAGAIMRGAFLDRATALNYIVLGDGTHGYACLADVGWGEANLAVVEWSRMQRRFLRRRLQPIPLGDEEEARKAKDNEGKSKDKPTRLREFKEATRASRQLARALRSQGLSDDADRFAYKTQVLQRQVLRRQGRFGATLGSWFFDLVSGYGYSPLRAFITYLLVVGAFAGVYALLAYFGLTKEQFGSWDSPLVLSVTSFHGRVFFAGGLPLTDWAARVGAIEAVFGLLIEITFIATFTQRFFAR